MKKLLLFLLITGFVLSCDQNSEDSAAQEIIDKAIERAGGGKYEKAEIEFIFREGRYKSMRDGGSFRLERFLTDSTGAEYHDVLDNEGFTRYQDDSVVNVSDSMKVVYSNSVNSVHYFVQLPYGLNAEAANKELLGKDSIQGQPYYEIKVTFDSENGGTDHEDEYVYWIHTSDFTIDYLAYNFETDDGGIRFRKAFNPREVEGLRFVDYKNYKYDKLSTPLHELDSLYEAGELTLISIIENEDVQVKIAE